MSTGVPGVLVLALCLVACSSGVDDGGGGGAADAMTAGGADAASGAADAPAPSVDAGGGGAADAAGGGGSEPAALAGITEAHNVVRAAHGVAPLSWDEGLAAIAQAWVERCVDTEAPIGLIDLNPDDSAAYGSYVGENLYGGSGPATGPDAVALWASEEASYDYANNTCSGSCGSYTQVVWAASLKLGCGIHSCAGLTYPNSIVCNYAPGGNTGGRPY